MKENNSIFGSDLELFPARLPEQTLDRIQNISDREGVSQAEVVRTLVNKSLDDDFYEKEIALDVLDDIQRKTSREQLQKSAINIQRFLLEQEGGRE
ncbi:MAG: hypothetical protein ABEJ07_06510 [Candidatus Nanohaloarchaea archaeon]